MNDNLLLRRRKAASAKYAARNSKKMTIKYKKKCDFFYVFCACNNAFYDRGPKNKRVFSAISLSIYYYVCAAYILRSSNVL